MKRLLTALTTALIALAPLTAKAQEITTTRPLKNELTIDCVYDIPFSDGVDLLCDQFVSEDTWYNDGDVTRSFFVLRNGEYVLGVIVSIVDDHHTSIVVIPDGQGGHTRLDTGGECDFNDNNAFCDLEVRAFNGTSKIKFRASY